MSSKRYSGYVSRQVKETCLTFAFATPYAFRTDGEDRVSRQSIAVAEPAHWEPRKGGYIRHTGCDSIQRLLGR